MEETMNREVPRDPGEGREGSPSADAFRALSDSIEGALPTLGNMEADLESVRSTISDLEEQARTFIRDQPVVSVLAAAGLGYLVARLASRGPR